MSIVFDLERTNQLSLLPDKDLVDLCPPIEPYQVTKNPKNKLDYTLTTSTKLSPSKEPKSLLVGLKQISSPNVAQSRFVNGKDVNILR
ncbi:hypothetical protein [Microcystis aeruginosa]|uniref:hypothetical protein n=1 Tax=Microcystis aeruginosa TaxID=1126 RepID=UPI000B182FD1|nr:hypothetical protein [Microcystis aeruginosa]BCU13630.1 hypothetical protein MAN88_41940 [Microcystis aeruginosa]